jgi:hypothetical protein
MRDHHAAFVGDVLADQLICNVHMVTKNNTETTTIRRNNDWKGRIAYEAKKKEEQKQKETFNTKEK